MSGLSDLSARPDAPSIREARPNDATPACSLIRSSIVELCFEDHGGDRGKLAAWLANKTPDNLRTWITQSHVFVAERDGRLVGVGALSGEGHITLLYVAPKERLTGVSKSLLLGLEERARDLGLVGVRVVSSLTARRFYATTGYAELTADPRRPLFGKTL